MPGTRRSRSTAKVAAEVRAKAPLLECRALGGASFYRSLRFGGFRSGDCPTRRRLWVCGRCNGIHADRDVDDEIFGNCIRSKPGERKSEEIMDLILGLRERHGMTILIASHDPLIVARCDRVIRIFDGAIVDDVRIPTSAGPDELLGRIGGFSNP